MVWKHGSCGSQEASSTDSLQRRRYLVHKDASSQRVLTSLDDIHFPALTVNRTIKFALRNKVPRERPEHMEKKHQFVQGMRDNILDSLGIGHTKKTFVGNEFIRGVSGGERKRVSLAEMMANQVCLALVRLTEEC